MKWVKFRIKTVTEAEDIIISTLYDLGLEGAQIEDKVPLTAMEKEQMFVDILPDGPEDDGIAYLSFFVEEKEDGSLEVAGEKTTTEAVLADVKRELEDLRQFMDIGEASVVVDETEDIDWINNWKQYFHQFYIDDILVIPSWENIKPEDTDKMVLHIDPVRHLAPVCMRPHSCVSVSCVSSSLLRQSFWMSAPAAVFWQFYPSCSGQNMPWEPIWISVLWKLWPRTAK